MIESGHVTKGWPVMKSGSVINSGHWTCDQEWAFDKDWVSVPSLSLPAKKSELAHGGHVKKSGPIHNGHSHRETVINSEPVIKIGPAQSGI